MKSIAERFEAKYIPEPNTGCWIWTGSRSCQFGYGGIRVDGETKLAHRISWVINNGEFPVGMWV
jgi:hypothetical protein